MEKISPKKSLGQNFLVDKNISGKIAGSLDCTSDDIVIEIGCGTGALTEQLLNKHPGFLYSVDVDTRAIEAVRNLLSQTNYENYEIIHADIREIQIPDLIRQRNFKKYNLKIIGNIPYNISADILFWIFANRDLINKAIIMLQKEVALRLTAKPNSKLYGITTVAMNLTGDCKALFNVSPGCFFPVPKVTSTVIEIIPNNDKFANIDFANIMTLVKAAFNQRRKVLRNALGNYLQKRDIKITDIIKSAPAEIANLFSKRAEQLSVENYILLNDYINIINENFEKDEI